MLELPFNEPFFTRGDFPPVVENGSTPIVLQNPWVNGTNATPFDQRGYLPHIWAGQLMRMCFFFHSLLLDLGSRCRRYERVVP